MVAAGNEGRSFASRVDARVGYVQAGRGDLRIVENYAVEASEGSSGSSRQVLDLSASVRIQIRCEPTLVDAQDAPSVPHAS